MKFKRLDVGELDTASFLALIENLAEVKNSFVSATPRVQVQPFAVETNDPAGFTIVDVLAWGSIGHAIA